MILPLIFFFSILILTYIYFKQKFSYWKNKGIHFLPPSTPLAHLKPIILGKECLPTNIYNIHKQFREKNLKYGGYYILTEPIFIIVDPDLLKQMYVTEFHAFQDRGMFIDEEREPLSMHLFAIEYEKWQFLRKKFSPTFTPLKIKSLLPLILVCTENLVESLKNSAKKQESVDIYELFARFTTDNIVSCAFGLESDNCNSTLPNGFRKCGLKFTQKSITQALSIACALYVPWILKFFKQTYIDPEITSFFMKTLKETVEFRETTKYERKDMLDMLIKLKNNISIEEDDTPSDGIAISFNDLASQAFIFFLGGFETTSAALTSALYELCLNEEIQDKLRKEVNEVFKKYDGKITFENVQEMHYLNGVVQEALRMYPPIGSVNRRCTESIRIPGTDVILEKGTRVVGSVLGIHRDPAFYENPLTFNPDRFSEKEKLNIKTGTYIPFGLGPKGCLGRRFALLVAKVCLATLIKNFKFTLDPKTKLPLDLSPKTFILVFHEILWLQVKTI